MVKKYTLRDRIDAIVKWIILIIAGAFTAFPFFWMVVSAFKTKEEIMDTNRFLPQSLHWENFISVLFSSPIPRYIFNSLFISLAVVFIQIITGALIAYAIVFMKFKGRSILFGIIMVTYMLPTAATYIPSYIILANHHLLNTYMGLIISSSVSIFGIFLLRQAFMQVPNAMVEAAQIDGASHFRILHLVVFPMTKTSVYKGYKRDKIEMRGDRAEMSDFPLYLNTVAGGLDRRDQTIGGFSFVVKIYAVPVVEIIR